MNNFQYKYLFYLSFLLLLPLNIEAQSEDSLTFAKGRMMTSLFGSLSNQQVNNASEENIKTTGYSIGTKSGYFLKNNWILGLNFTISKTELANTNVDINSEDLLLGLWSRLYFAEKGSAALYFELTPYYTSIHRTNIIVDKEGLLNTKEQISGKGFGILPGFGFTYIINRNVGFGMTLAYSWTQMHVDIEDQILNSITSDTYLASQLQFSFNFQIYIDQFFF